MRAGEGNSSPVFIKERRSAVSENKKSCKICGVKVHYKADYCSFCKWLITPHCVNCWEELKGNFTKEGQTNKSGLCRTCYLEKHGKEVLPHDIDSAKKARSSQVYTEARARKVSKSLKAYYSSEESELTRKRLGESSRANWQNEELRSQMLQSRHESEAFKQAMSNRMIDLWQDEEYREKVLSKRRGKKRNYDQKKNISIGVARAWDENKDFRDGVLSRWTDPNKYRKSRKLAAEVNRRPEKREASRQSIIKRMKNGELIGKSPNGLEEKLLGWLTEIKSGFKFTGDGKFWVNGRNPDFVKNSTKQVILLNGSYWHQDKEKEKETLKRYKKFGYKVLVLDEDNMRNHAKPDTLEILRKFSFSY